MATIKFEVTVDVDRVTGKFATKDEIADYIAEELHNANPSTIDGIGADGESEYEVTGWEVERV